MRFNNSSECSPEYFSILSVSDISANKKVKLMIIKIKKGIFFIVFPLHIFGSKKTEQANFIQEK
ncbi:MAG: hypothetical protein B6D62_03670 [Candidatus Cloacimonas sp. 4484_275]|nr:MAG: hypothetical protein B6D62_03670 [Candidatus Cloacimonas sp. 4484_275]